MVLLANLAQLSFGSIFERFLPVAGHLTRAFVQKAYVMCVVSAFVIATIYVFSGVAHEYIPSSIVWRIFFIVAVVLWTLFILQDSVLIGLRASKWVPVENILFAAAKLALLPIVLLATARQGIFVAWTAPVGLTIIVVTWYLFTKRIPEHQAASQNTENLPATRELFLLAGAQYATLLFGVFTPSIVSLIVIDRIGAVANAHYYVPSLIASSLAVFNWNIVRSFLVEAASEPYALRRHAKVTAQALAAVLLPCIAIGVIFAPEILRIFGSSYAATGTTLMRMLLFSLLGNSVTIYYSSFAWLDKKVWAMAIREFFSVGIFLSVLLILIGHFGLLAIGIASLVSSGLQGFFFLPISIRRYRMTKDTEPPHGQISGATGP
jgi:O-antigen/teichoic acid export membrane protein